MKEDLDLFSINVANVIGNNVDPFIVKEIISISNNEKYIFHGIKNNKCFYRINIEGIKPLSPEGGKGSYWSSGKRLFGSETSVFSTYDTTFFHYAHTNESENKSLMSLAILKYENSELKLKDFF
ncbi:hypothetical protein J4446_03500 [Candidatus Woesearchaeota archaeon]|nr:hypothetical protein [Candidatus Woesearchaeota archaeon]